MLKPQKEGRVYCSGGCPEIEVIHATDNLAYLAGLMDAEGSFYMTGNKYPAISAYNNNRRLLELIQNMAGGGIHQNHRGEYHLRICGEAPVSRACNMLIPRLVLKKRQAELLLEAFKKKSMDRWTIGDELKAMNAKSVQITPPPDTPALKIVTSKSSADWSYFAGWVDGDATLVITQWNADGKNKYYYAQLHIYSAKPAPLLWLQERFGGQFESRKRGKKLQWISSLAFEDQVYTEKILEALRPHVYDRQEQIDLMLSAMKKPPYDRRMEFEKIKELNGKFRGLHKFTKNADGTYTDGKRSTKKPHRTHRGKDIWVNGERPSAASLVLGWDL